MTRSSLRRSRSVAVLSFLVALAGVGSATGALVACGSDATPGDMPVIPGSDGGGGTTDGSTDGSTGGGVVTGATTKVVLTTTGGFIPSPPDGSTCTGGTSVYTVDIAAGTLAYVLCKVSSTPEVAETGTIALSSSESATLFAKLQAIAVAPAGTTNECAEDAAAEYADVTTSGTTARYTNPDTVCDSNGAGTPATGVGEAIVAADTIVEEHLSQAGDAGVSDGGAPSVVTASTTSITLDQTGGFVAAAPDGSACGGPSEHYVFNVTAGTFTYSNCTMVDGGLYTLSSGTVTLDGTDATTLLNDCKAIVLDGRNNCAVDGPADNVTVSDTSGTTSYANCPSDGGASASNIPTAIGAFRAHVPN